MARVGIVQVAWGPREETPGELAERLTDLVEELQPFLEFVRVPVGILHESSTDPDLSPPNLERAIEAGVRVDDRGMRWEERGYSVSLYARDEAGASVTISMAGGAREAVRRVALNTVTIEADDAFPLEAFRGFAETNLLALVDAFEPAYGWAAEPLHVDVNPLRGGPKPRLGPIAWVSDALAPVPEVSGLALERHGDGTLMRLQPKRDENVWVDTAPTERALDALAKAGWAPKLTDLNPAAE